MTVELLPLQHQVLAIPSDVECVALGGSKGGGKTSAVWLKLGQRIQSLRAEFSGAFCRVSHPALAGPMEDASAWFTRLGMQPLLNKHDATIRFPAYGNALLRFFALDDRVSVLARTSGLSLSDVVVDELQVFPSFDLPMLIVGCMRTAPGTTSLLMCTFNPGGIAAPLILKAFIEPSEKHARGVPFSCDAVQRRTVVLESNYRDNRFINREAYARSLVAMAAGNASYLAQVDEGSWRSIVGNYYAVTSDNLLEWPEHIDWNDFPHLQPKAACDWGSQSPYCVSFGLRVNDRAALPCGRVVARGSLILFSELTSADETQGWTRAAYFASVPEIARAYLHRCAALGLPALKLVLDAAAFAKHGSSTGSLADEFKAAGVHVVPSDKPKLNVSFPLMRERVWNARSGDAMPCIVFARRQVPYHLASFTLLPAAANNPDVPAESPLMHAQDAARYLLHSASPGAAPVVVTQHMSEVSVYSDPNEVRFNMQCADIRRYAHAKEERRKRDNFVKGPPAKFDFDAFFKKHDKEPTDE
jgi:Phage terminase large subunit